MQDAANAGITLDEDNLSIIRGTQTVKLLPKEFDLLAYLYRHPGRVFTRDQLLDAVWADEAPTDRTVDDHVYRLRKKLDSLQSFSAVRCLVRYSIETVRGRGYRLCIETTKPTAEPASRPEPNPVLQTQAYQDHIRNMLDQYTLYGHGTALHTMAAQPDVFGVDANHELYLRAQFQAGNFLTVVEDRNSTFEQRLFWLLCLYRTIHDDPRHVLKYFWSAVDNYLMRTEDYLEIQCFQIPSLYLHAGDLDAAEQFIADAVMMTEAMDLDGYRPAIRLLEVSANLHRHRYDDAHFHLDRVHAFLAKNPWQREVAYCEMLEGLYALCTGNAEVGRKKVRGGIERIDQVSIPGHHIMRVDEMLQFVTHVRADAPLQRELTKQWKTLARRYDFAAIERSIERQFAEYGLL